MIAAAYPAKSMKGMRRMKQSTLVGDYQEGIMN